jgi:hypothetical protein
MTDAQASGRNWALLIYDQAMTFKTAYSYTTDSITVDGIGAVSPTLANIQDLKWSVTANEDSLEATWLGDSNGQILDIDPHDRALIATKGYRTGEDSNTFYLRYRGVMTLPANRNHTDGEEHWYRALGIGRLLESVDTGPNHQIDEGQDLASVVAEAIVDGSAGASFTVELPSGVTHSSAFSAIGVTNTGKINPGSADLAQNFDKLVALCELSNVQAAWGVKPTGALFFEEAATTTLEVQEGAAGTVVEWAEPQADEIISAVRWVLTSGNQRIGPVSQITADLETEDQLTHLSDSGITTYGSRTITLTPPEEANPFKEPSSGSYSLVAGSLQASWVGRTQDATADLGRAHDGDPSSYAVITPDASGVVALSVSWAGFPKSIKVIAVSLMADPDSDPPDRAYAYVRTHNSGSGVSERAAFHNLFGTTKVRGLATAAHDFTEGLDEITTTLVFGDRTAGGAVDTSPRNVRLTVVTAIATGTARVAIADFRCFEIDTGTLNALAEQEYKFPTADAFKALIQGEVTPAGLASITKLNGTTLSDLPVTAISTHISGQGGVQTHVVVGPRVSAETTELFNRVKRRDRLAALSGAKAGRRRAA